MAPDMKFEPAQLSIPAVLQPESMARTQSSLLDKAHAIEDQKAPEEQDMVHESLQISHTALLSPEDSKKQSSLPEEAHAIVHKHCILK